MPEIAIDNLKGDVPLAVFDVGGGVQGRVFEDIEMGFFANIHIWCQLNDIKLWF